MSSWINPQKGQSAPHHTDNVVAAKQELALIYKFAHFSTLVAYHSLLVDRSDGM